MNLFTKKSFLLIILFTRNHNQLRPSLLFRRRRSLSLSKKRQFLFTKRTFNSLKKRTLNPPKRTSPKKSLNPLTKKTSPKKSLNPLTRTPNTPNPPFFPKKKRSPQSPKISLQRSPSTPPTLRFVQNETPTHLNTPDSSWRVRLEPFT